jgi:hypothetical protein
MPRMEKGAADSMSIVAMLVYMLDISGESTSRIRARIRMRRKQIIEVTMIFKLTLSDTHGTASWIGFPFRIIVPGMADSTTVMIETTAKQKTKERPQSHSDELLHEMNDTYDMRRTSGGQVYQCWKGDDMPL